MASKINISWGTGIFIVILLFLAGMATMVTYVQRNLNFQLVAQDYYEQEIAYQEEINRQSLGMSDLEKPTVSIDSSGTGHIRLDFPNQAQVSNVEVALMRLNDAAMDYTLPITPGKVTPLQLPAPGAWRLRISWTSQVQECALSLGTIDFH